MSKQKEILRKSGPCETHTAIGKDYLGLSLEFFSSSFCSPDKSDQKTLRVYKEPHGPGITIEVGRSTKRGLTTNTYHIGKDELKLLIEYIDSVSAEVQNYAGVITSK